MIMVPEAAVKFAVRDGDGVSGQRVGDRGDDEYQYNSRYT